MTTKRILWLLLCVVFIIPLPISYSQQTTVITVAVPAQIISGLNPETIFASFYEDYPSVRVAFVPSPSSPLYMIEDPEEYFEELAKLAQTADILYLSDHTLSVADTRTGYFLDLQPLVQVGNNQSDYFPPAWKAHYWDGGVWALPLSFSMQIVSVNPTTMESSTQLAPFSGDWTIEQLIDTVQATNGIAINDGIALVRSLHGQPFYLEAPENTPNFATTEMAETLQQLLSLVHLPQTDGTEPSFLMMDFRFSLLNRDGSNRQGFTFPGGVVGTRTTGLAISAATAHPEIAYQVALYLTQQPYFVNAIPAYRPLAEQLNVFPLSETFYGQSVDEPTRQMLINALETGLPASEFLYEYHILSVLLTLPENAGLEEILALLQAEQNSAESQLAMAESLANTQILVVPTAVPTMVLSPGETDLIIDEGGGGWSTHTNSNQIREALTVFADADPVVGRVTLIRRTMDNPSPYFDCGTVNLGLFQSNVLAQNNLSLNIRPVLEADAELSEADFVPGVLLPFTWNEQYLGLPLGIFPTTMMIDADKFRATGLPIPGPNWTVVEFENALRLLHEAGYPKAEAPSSIMEIFMLAVSFGGMPIDLEALNQTPSQVRFQLTTPETIAAFQAVLDLARNDLMDYNPIGEQGPVTFGPAGPAVYFSQGSVTGTDLQLVPYPKGNKYAPATFTVQGITFAPNANNPEACYRLYRFMQARPELLGHMPVLRSEIENPQLGASIGFDRVEMYRAFSDRLEDPQVVILPSSLYLQDMPGTDHRIEWIQMAFDEYVLNQGNLQELLTSAQEAIDGYDACVETLEKPTLTSSRSDIDLFVAGRDACAESNTPQ